MRFKHLSTMPLTLLVFLLNWMSSHCVCLLVRSIYRTLVKFMHIDIAVFTVLTHAVKSTDICIYHMLLVSLFSPVKEKLLWKDITCLLLTQIFYGPYKPTNINVNIWPYVRIRTYCSFQDRIASQFFSLPIFIKTWYIPFLEFIGC